jgi:S-sulfo-L-cysteine synthase (O-acetyl-L-serine-dependent)
MYKTIEDCVGNTPLVRLKRMPGETSNTVLVKLEGNNPAGSVKDRPALSMIERAEARGEIKPGDTLIEATSGNTGIALAMAAAIGLQDDPGHARKPEHRASPDHARLRRRTGADASKGRHGAVRATSPKCATRAGHHPRPVRQPGQSARPTTEGTGPEIWRDTGGITHFVSSMGTTGTIMGCSRYLKAQNPAIQIVGCQPEEGSADSRHPQMAGSLCAEDLRQNQCRPHEYVSRRPRPNDDPASGDRGRHLRRHLVRRRAGRVGGAASVEGRGKRGHRFHRL